MAKEIKAIKCPQCSSTSKTEIKPDVYRCNNCQTEYYLDDDDITVNYNHNYGANAPAPGLDQNQQKKMLTGIAILIAVIVLLFLFNRIFSDSRPNVSANSPTVEEKKEELPPYEVKTISNYTFTQTSTQVPIVMYVTHREYRDPKDDQKTGLYFLFYNPLQKKLIKEVKLPDQFTDNEVKFRTFSDGNVYFMMQNNMYKLDQDGLTLMDVGTTFFKSQPKFEAGIVSATFDNDDRGDALEISTNDGKKFYYYPLIQKIYKAGTDDRARAEWGFKNLLPVARKKQYHTFSTESSDFPEEKIQLLTVSYLDNGPGPKKMPSKMSWFKDYFAAGGNGLYTDRDPYVKSLFGVYQEASCRIYGAKDLTPGRNYFSPKIAFENDTTLLIEIKGDASKSENYKLQKINIKNGKIEWTTELPGCCLRERLVKFKNGYIGSLKEDEYIAFDLNGKIIDKQIHLPL
jgi:DNA-directed RNA polymerase subunit RPC12/RpoP